MSKNIQSRTAGLLRAYGIASFSVLLAFGHWCGQASRAETENKTENPTQAQCEAEPEFILDISDDREALNNWRNLGHAEFLIGNHAGAEASFERMRSIAEQRGDRGAVAYAMSWMGKLNSFRFSFHWTDERLAMMWKRPEGEEPKPSYAKKLFDRAQELFENAIQIDKDLNQQDRIVEGYTNLAYLYSKRDENDPTAETLLKQAIVVGEEAKLEEEMRRPYQDLAKIYLERGAFDEAERLYRLALALAVKTNDLKDQLFTVEQLQKVYAGKGDSSQAEAMRKQAAELSGKICAKVSPSSFLTIRKALYFSSRMMPVIQMEAAEVLKHERALGHEVGAATSLTLIAMMHQELKDFDQAEANYQDAIALTKSQGRNEELANLYGDLAGLAMKREDKAKACEYWLLAEQNDPEDRHIKRTKEHLGCSG
jgi:tetratricopeptide (TPR) repeat protein